MATLTQALLGPARVVRRLFVPEALLLGLLLWAPSLDFFPYLAPYTGLLAAAAALGTAAVGWRFRRGRVVFGTGVLLFGALLPALPPGPILTLAALLIAADLLILGVLPERGILTRSGAVRGTLLGGQLVALLALVLFRPPIPTVPRTVPVPWPGPVDGVLGSVDLVLAATAAAALLLALGALRGGPMHRGLLWGAVAVLGSHAGLAGGAAWHALAAVLMLLVAALEDAHRMAYQDPLTGLPSRRALDEMLQRMGGRYTVAMVDVDHFKKFNDRHGHDVGDEVLRMVAARIRETPGARAFRYGGEEFTLVFRGKSLDQVRDRLEKTRRRIGDGKFVIRGPDRPKRKPKRTLFLWRPRQTLKVTASLGAAERTGREPPEQVLAAADRALYRAKDGGRNRVVA